MFKGKGSKRRVREGKWIEAYDMTHRNMQYRYFTSLNWAMTNFAPGS